jgi:NADH-quinone oxidoreductase subunit L
VLYPLLGFGVIIFFTRWKEKLSSMLSIGLITVALIHSLIVLYQMILRHGKTLEFSIPFIDHPALHLELGMWLDPLTAVMLVTVCIVSGCVQVYSIGYMHGDPRYSRYFSYLSLFSFSMLGLVIANNFFMIFIFWELVGVSSYLLIGFWFEKKVAADAGKKAFITNRVGDFGFLIGLMILAAYAGTLNYQEVFGKVMAGTLDPNIVALAGVFVFCGAIGKSAQFPLHVWLPDAMEGPTPVSALIHAATMVAAGVYLVARAMSLFAGSITASYVVAFIGLITSFMAASIAITQIDIKRVLAFSTCSQLGYMIMALGLYGVDFAHAFHSGHMDHFHSPGWYAGTFHLMTHAFFKALLFLGAGSVIHAVHTNDINEMGGLGKKMPITRTTFLIACLAISGIFPFAGFFSKDEIVAATKGHPFFMFFTLVIAFMTAFYMFRLFFMTFTGKPRNEERFAHAHESPKNMTIPLMILGFLSVTAGWVGWPTWEHGFASFVYHHQPYHVHPDWILMPVSVLIGLSGIGLAYLIYKKRAISREAIGARIRWLYVLSYNKFYFDEIYQFAVIDALMNFSRVLWWFDANVIDGLVNFTGWLTVKWADIKEWFDTYIVDGMVNGAGYVCMAGAWILKFVQTGAVQFYALVVIASALGLVIYRAAGNLVWIYLGLIIVLAVARLVAKMARPRRTATEPNIDEV